MKTLQQVNLFRPEFRPEMQAFSFYTMLGGWGVILLLFASLQLWGWYQTQNTRQGMANLERHQVTVLQQLTAMRDSKPKNRNEQLDSNIKKFQTDIARRRQILQLMQGRKLGNTTGFSGFLVGLSRQVMAGLSLEHIGLLQGGNYVELSGQTYRADLVPGYLQRLRAEDSFRKTRFGEMSIKQIEGQGAAALRFKFGEGDIDGS